jgi:hypothetical protein
MKSAHVVGISTLAFCLGFAAAWYAHGGSELDEQLATFYGPRTQFGRSAVTVIHINAGRVEQARDLNCLFMRNAVAALDKKDKKTAQIIRSKLQHYVKTGLCGERNGA